MGMCGVAAWRCDGLSGGLEVSLGMLITLGMMTRQRRMLKERKGKMVRYRKRE